jgi:RPC5 protein
MDIEQKNLPEGVLAEYDVFLKIPSKDLYLIQYPSRFTDTAFSQYESIDSLQVQPDQRKLSMTVNIDRGCENYSENSGNLKYELDSKVINNRTNYCIGHISGNSMFLIPVSTCVQMKKSFRDYEEKFKVPEENKAGKERKDDPMADFTVDDVNSQLRKKDNLKLLERKIRTHPFQKMVFDSEAPIPLKLHPQESEESSRLVQSLLDPPTEFKTLKPLSRSEYMKYLF